MAAAEARQHQDVPAISGRQKSSGGGKNGRNLVFKGKMVKNQNYGIELAILKSEWDDTIQNDGGHCPVCDRWGKIYPRGINSTMARSLIWLASKGTEWVDVPNTAPTWVLRSNQLPTLRWWDMVERNDSNKKEEMKHSGMWRVTEYGRLFSQNKIQSPDKVFTYNGEVIGRSDSMTNIEQCFKQNFDYREVFDSLNLA